MVFEATLSRTASGRLVVRAARLFKTRRRFKNEKGNAEALPEDLALCSQSHTCPPGQWHTLHHRLTRSGHSLGRDGHLIIVYNERKVCAPI